MRKLILLIAILLSSFKSFSQKIILSEKQAKAVARDLVDGKACKEELEITRGILELMEGKVHLKDGVIQNMEKQKSELLQKDLIRLAQLEAKDRIIADTERQLLRTNRKTTLYKIVAVAGILGSGFMLISR